MEDQLTKIEFTEGLVITLVGVGLVFLTLTLLFLLFIAFTYLVPKVMNMINKPKKIVIKKGGDDLVINSTSVSGEVNAAIAAAVYHYMEEAHDDESTTLTIQKVKKAYSPWSSKIYSVHGNQLNR